MPNIVIKNSVLGFLNSEFKKVHKVICLCAARGMKMHSMKHVFAAKEMFVFASYGCK